jgi:tetratricopeptide (TPR) repeat protein
VQVREELREALELDPSNPQVLWRIAYGHVLRLKYLCPDIYDLPAALRYARIAVEKLPTSEYSRRTLAIALFRTSAYAEAIERHKTVLPNFAGHALDKFFLAMDYWCLGRKEKARVFFDEAVAWMDEHAPKSPELRLVRDEAATLLGRPTAPAKR